jgi:hypothetical protein
LRGKAKPDESADNNQPQIFHILLLESNYILTNVSTSFVILSAEHQTPHRSWNRAARSFLGHNVEQPSAIILVSGLRLFGLLPEVPCGKTRMLFEVSDDTW